MNLGDTVVDIFERQPPFHFVRKESTEAADEALKRGEVYFELITSRPDFSERALTARQDVPANFTLRVAGGRELYERDHQQTDLARNWPTALQTNGSIASVGRRFYKATRRRRRMYRCGRRSGSFA